MKIHSIPPGRFHRVARPRQVLSTVSLEILHRKQTQLKEVLDFLNENFEAQIGLAEYAAQLREDINRIRGINQRGGGA